jgi:zinc transport system ATP-binding protein
MKDEETLIDCQNVSFFVESDDRKVDILTNINLAVQRGKILTIIGPNGAGKTTLLKIILKLIQPSEGRVVYKKNLKIGYMPQKVSINYYLPITVENFLQIHHDEKIDNKKIEKTLEELQITDIAKYNLTEISGGEMQKVMLARAILKKPDLLILDEPTQGVDLIGQKDFYSLLIKLQKQNGCAILMVSHDLYLVMSKTDHVLCLNKHVCCHGEPNLVQNHPDYIKMLPEFATYTHHHDHTH